MLEFKYKTETFFKIINIFDFEIISISSVEIIGVKDDLILTMTAFKTGNGTACTAKLFSKSKNITLGLPFKDGPGGCNQKKHRLSENYLVSDVSIMIDAIELCDSDGFMDMEITKWNKDSGFGFAKNIYILKAFIHISQIPIDYRKNDMEGFKFKGKYTNNDTRGPKITEIEVNSGYFSVENKPTIYITEEQGN